MPPRKFPARSAGVKVEKDQTLREFVADYFAERHGDQIVRRKELAMILVNFNMVIEQRSLWSRIKRSLMHYYNVSARAPVAKDDA